MKINIMLKMTKEYSSAICLFYGDYTELASRKSEQAKYILHNLAEYK
jgi:hypothetical protein